MSNKLLSRWSVIRVFSLVSIIVLLLVCSIRMPVFTTNSDDRSLQFVDPVNLESHVRILSEKYIPRSCVGTGALDNAAADIKDEFKKSNLNTVAQPYLFGGRQYSNIVSPGKPCAFLIGVDEMKLTELGHVKDKDPGHKCGLGYYSSTLERSGGIVKAIYKQARCLIKHSTQGLGEPATRGRT